MPRSPCRTGARASRSCSSPTNKDANRHDIVGWAHNHGVSELAIPRRIVVVDEIPVLGTGKTDYVGVQKMLPAVEAKAG